MLPAVVASFANSWTTPRLIREKLVKSNDYIVQLHSRRPIILLFVQAGTVVLTANLLIEPIGPAKQFSGSEMIRSRKIGGETGLFLIAVAILAVKL